MTALMSVEQIFTILETIEADALKVLPPKCLVITLPTEQSVSTRYAGVTNRKKNKNSNLPGNKGCKNMLHRIRGGRAGNISFMRAQISTGLHTDLSKDPVFGF